MSTTWDRSFSYTSSAAAADRFPNNYTNDYNGTINGRRLSPTTHATKCVCCMCVCVSVCLESESVKVCVCVRVGTTSRSVSTRMYLYGGVRVHRLASFLLLWAFLVYGNRPSVSPRLPSFTASLLRARKHRTLPMTCGEVTARVLKKTAYKYVRNEEIK